MLKILGVFRELLHSPNRETDDALIMKAVIEELGSLGAQASLAEPEKLDESLSESWDAVVPMCEAYPRLMKLREWQWETDSLILNAPEAVLNTYRTRTSRPCGRTSRAARSRTTSSRSTSTATW